MTRTGVLSRTISLMITTFILNLPLLASGNSKLTAYEVLEEYGFPIGLLPKGVVGYELNSTTGAFEVYFNKTCTYSIDSYELKYKKTVSGVISMDELKSLKGISVKVWWFWFSIKEVVRDDDELEFNVGVATADFAVSKFDKCPSCGCGFDCVNSKLTNMEVEEEMKMKMKMKLEKMNGTMVSSS
ncbi:hypothetical protein Dimus_029773 [Dionaea muscipula]